MPQASRHQSSIQSVHNGLSILNVTRGKTKSINEHDDDEILQLSLLSGSDSWRLESANGVDFAPATDRKQHQQQQHRLLDIIERLLLSLHGTNNDDYEWPDDAVITVPKQQLSSGWRQVDVDRGDVNKRPWLSRLRRTLKRGPGMCINNCLTGGMSFVRCKSMCHW